MQGTFSGTSKLPQCLRGCDELQSLRRDEKPNNHQGRHKTTTGRLTLEVSDRAIHPDKTLPNSWLLQPPQAYSYQKKKKNTKPTIIITMAVPPAYHESLPCESPSSPTIPK